MKEYQRCTRCIMDNASDDTIIFNEKGECNYCIQALSEIGDVYYPNKEGEKRLKKYDYPFEKGG